MQRLITLAVTEEKVETVQRIFDAGVLPALSKSGNYCVRYVRGVSLMSQARFEDSHRILLGADPYECSVRAALTLRSIDWDDEGTTSAFPCSRLADAPVPNGLIYIKCEMSHYLSILGAINLAVHSKKLLDDSALRSSAQVRIAVFDALAELRRTREVWDWDGRHTSQSEKAEAYWTSLATRLGFDPDTPIVCANPDCPAPDARAALVCAGCSAADAPVYDSKACQLGAPSPLSAD